MVEVVWLILREGDETAILVELAVLADRLADRLAVVDAVPVVCSKPVETVVLLGLAGLVAVVWTEPGEIEVVLLGLPGLVAVVWTELGEIEVLLGLAGLVAVVWTELGEIEVLLGLAGLVAVVWTEPGERVPSLALVVDRLILVVCFEVVGNIVPPEFVAMLPALVGCPEALGRMLPPVLMSCTVLVVCSRPIEELVWLALKVFCAAAEVTEEGMAVVCREAADVLSCTLVARSEGVELVTWPGGA